MQLWPLLPALGSSLRHRPGPVGALILAAASPVVAGAGEPEGGVSAVVTGLRSAKGQVVACLTTRPDTFPECERDPQARAVKMPAAASVLIDFGPVPAGRYAIALFHDENGNGRLDKRLMLPREGYGFSRDAPVVMGPPRFARAAFAVDATGHHQSIRMRYLL
jgi:uncharacterized protein (DUF2141 family)